MTVSRQNRSRLPLQLRTERICAQPRRMVALHAENGKEIAAGHIGDLPFVEEPIRLHPRDLLRVDKRRRQADDARHRRCSAHLLHASRSLFNGAAGQPIFFDDGKIEGRIREVHPDHMLVEIVHARRRRGQARFGQRHQPSGNRSRHRRDDRERPADLDFVAEHADIVGLSFVRRPEDVLELQQELAARGKSQLGIILKIESRRGSISSRSS